jgi:mycofactocin glycosyltransferase
MIGQIKQNSALFYLHPSLLRRDRRKNHTDEFIFSLAPNVSLEAKADGYFLESTYPLKKLRINESLFHLLEHISVGESTAQFIKNNPVMNAENIPKVLLMLVGGGYLKLEKVSAVDFPFVSIILPVRDDPDNLRDCIKSLENLNYPKDKLEIIIVDDGSKQEVSKIISSTGVHIIRNEIAKGQSACRNAGAAIAKGETLGFIDADCVASENWLAEMVPFFKVTGTGAVGGFIRGYYHKSFLDRYENAFSSLNMGKCLIMETKSSSTFYVPTANLLVDREVFKAVGGFNESMRIGEDVDFCWRLRGLGYTLVYAPFGAVAHKHRNRLGRMLKRRADYGSSEALLYGKHRDKGKTFSISLFSGLSWLALVLAIVLWNPYLLLGVLFFYVVDTMIRLSSLRMVDVPVSRLGIFAFTLRIHFSSFYYAFYHLTRYYLVLFVGFGFLWWPLWIVGGLELLWAAVVDFMVKKPALFFPVFLFYYLLEQLAYQVGVFMGCFKYRYFGSYLLSFKASKG